MEYVVYIILGIVLFLIISGVVAMLIVTKPIGVKVYEEQLVRNKPEKWGRSCSEPSMKSSLVCGIQVLNGRRNMQM